MQHMLLIKVLVGICLLVKVSSETTTEQTDGSVADTTSCRRSLNSTKALICSDKHTPADKLDCGLDTVIRVVAIYAGLKHRPTSVCPDNAIQTSRYIPSCCTLDQKDSLINIDNITTQLKGNSEYELLKKATQNCDGEHECSVPSVVIPVINGLAWRNYSNFILVEYRCSRDDDQDSSLQRKRALTCSYKERSGKDARAEDLECTGGLVINVISVFVGLKGYHANDCPNMNTSISGFEEHCCQYDKRDYIFDAICLRDKQTSTIVSYGVVLTTATACNGKNMCRIPSRILPSHNSATTRNYSSYIMVEYTCAVGRNGDYSSTKRNEEFPTTDMIMAGSSPNYDDKDTPSGRNGDYSSTKRNEEFPTTDMIMAGSSPNYDDKDTPSGVQLTTIGIIVGVVLLVASLLVGVVWLRKRRPRDTADVHINLEGRLVTPRPTGESGYEDMPLADQAVYDVADQEVKNPNVDDTYDHAVTGGGCFASAKGDGYKGDDTYDHAMIGSGSDAEGSSVRNGTSLDVDDTYDHAMIGSGNGVKPITSTKGKRPVVDDTYNHALIGSGSDAKPLSSNNGTSLDADDTYDHALIRSGSDAKPITSKNGTVPDIDDTYNHAMLGSSSDA